MVIAVINEMQYKVSGLSEYININQFLRPLKPTHEQNQLERIYGLSSAVFLSETFIKFYSASNYLKYRDRYFFSKQWDEDKISGAEEILSVFHRLSNCQYSLAHQMKAATAN